MEANLVSESSPSKPEGNSPSAAVGLVGGPDANRSISAGVKFLSRETIPFVALKYGMREVKLGDVPVRVAPEKPVDGAIS
jgi:hypothetical protein